MEEAVSLSVLLPMAPSCGTTALSGDTCSHRCHLYLRPLPGVISRQGKPPAPGAYGASPALECRAEAEAFAGESWGVGVTLNSRLHTFS